MNRIPRSSSLGLLGLALLWCVTPGSGKDERPHWDRPKVLTRHQPHEVEAARREWNASVMLDLARSVVPEPVTVNLGASGASVTLEMNEDGNYSVSSHIGVASYTSAADGTPVRVNTRTGKSYVLWRDASGMWMATFAPDPVTVTLGTSGTTVEVAKAEDGSFLVDGKVLVQGGIVVASNGASYSLKRNEAGIWTATFAPLRTTVRLGASDENVTISTTEDGRYVLSASGGFDSYKSAADGTPVRVTVRNGNSYALSKDANGEWSATFLPPATVPVRLGASGTIIGIQQAEDGSYSVGGEPLEEGGTVVADNGSVYALVIGEKGRWTAVFVPPQTTVRLGFSGESVIVETAEDGSFSIGGKRLEDGTTVTTSKGLRYTLTIGTDGSWLALFRVPDPVSVELGASGTIVEIQRGEDGTYSIGDQVLGEGYAHQATNGESYTLSMDADGTWIATHKGVETRVDLGTSGDSVTLVRGEDGRYSRDGSVLESGEIVVATNGGSYRLHLEPDGEWGASYVPSSQTVSLGVSGA